MQPNERKNGFIVREVTELPEQKATLVRMEFEKNGAQLLWMDNGEDNKLFSIAFCTLPSDDTGVFHILEHSVLNGSERFPVREPFVELCKSSMNTFLNAMTFPDKTVYPVSSRNETDFLNLVQVYLDAVFAPAIYHNRHIFEQEGWHYELSDASETPTYRGVVFNEMKGALSSVGSRLYNGINRMLFPDNCYRFVSGGDPKKIPALTYEQFLDAHRRFYNASNAKIYLDGNVPLESVLPLLEEYLQRYDRQETVQFAWQEAPAAARTVEFYAIGAQEQAEKKAHFASAKLATDYTDVQTQLAMQVLASYLTSSNESPLSRAVLKKGLAQSVSVSLLDGVAQVGWMLHVGETEFEHVDAIRDTVRETVEELLAVGLDRDELDAAIDMLEFRLHEREEPAGLDRNINMLSSWLYGGDPMLYLSLKEPFAALRNAPNGYYEELLRTLFFDDAHTVELCLLPSKTVEETERQAENAALAAAKASWSEEQLQALLEENEKLRTWQQQADTPEQLATLPTLPLSAVGEDPMPLPTEELTVDGVRVLFHPSSDDGMLQCNLYFSLNDCDPATLSACSFFIRLFGELPTRKHSVLELQREIKRTFSFATAPRVISDNTQAERCRFYFLVSCSMLPAKLPRAVELLQELLQETVFTGEESASLMHDVLRQAQSGFRRAMISAGNSAATLRARSHVSAGAWVEEQCTGYAQLQYLNDFSENFDARAASFADFAAELQQKLFCASRMLISLTASEQHTDALHALVERFGGQTLQALPESLQIPVDGKRAREVICIPADISYAASATLLSKYNASHNGALELLGTLLSYEYLWNEVRVRGGAYGCRFRSKRSGSVQFSSYRDPSPLRSLQIFADTSAFVRAFCDAKTPLSRYIVSAIGSSEPLLSQRDFAAAADDVWLNGVSYEDRKQLRGQLLRATHEDLLACCDLFDAMAESSPQCIVGSSAVAKACGDDWTQLPL